LEPKTLRRVYFEPSQGSAGSKQLEPDMRILIAGGTGMIGRVLVTGLLADGHEVWVLTRNLHKARLPEGARLVAWDGRTSRGWGELAGQVEAVVNLVGERISKWPWTPARKRRFWDSRVEGGQALVQAIQAADRPPRLLLQASGVNYYGFQNQAPLSEQAGPGEDFMAELSQAWEASTLPVERLGVRRVILRSGVVLSARDGILPLMLLPARLWAGGRLGRGTQGLPWIHLEDEVGAIRFLLQNPHASGPFNLTSPTPISSAEFLRTAAAALHRPFWLHIPAWALRLALGEMATLILDGAYLYSGKLQGLGYHFRFGTAEQALRDLLGG
jgi:uncharacterized protein